MRTYCPSDQQPKTGDPALFMGMAQRIRPTGNAPQRISALNIDFERSVPYRRKS